jgi:hypothetical protein
MIVSVTSYLIMKVPQNEQLVVKGFEWLKNSFVFKVFPYGIRPKLIWNGTVWAEHNNKPLLRSGCIRIRRKEA